MTIHIPKIDDLISKEEEAYWSELYNRLYQIRVLFSGAENKYDISNRIIHLMIHLNIEDETKDQYLFINCPGGLAIYGLAIYNTMQYIKTDVNTIGLGVAASMGSMILVGGEITSRVALPNVRIMIHQHAISYFGSIQTRECLLEGDEVNELRKIVTNIYVRKTRQPLWVIERDMKKTFFLYQQQKPKIMELFIL